MGMMVRGIVQFCVAGHFKTSQPGPNQNRLLQGASFISGFLVQARDSLLIYSNPNQNESEAEEVSHFICPLPLRVLLAGPTGWWLRRMWPRLVRRRGRAGGTSPN